ncbi:radical SAM protein [Clostridium sp. MCC353]|uniref:radical SAM protein n=1 Tax=Clostridium sp. MCC353 TaxID=2592646 RepID=UPI001C01052A|nr:radical SAM protein [Clostridium sp. MCC353]
MEEIKRFFECLLPVTACNLKCSYCYIIQRDNRNMKIPELKYSPERIGAGLSQERLGGICYLSICGEGETLIPEEIVHITYEILKQGHYVNLTTNGTITKRFDELMKLPIEYKERLHFAFSLHYLELKRTEKLNEFYSNVRKVKENGCSFLVQLNLCDEYEPYLDEISEICKKEIGALPQLAATRKENNLSNDIELMTSHTAEEYLEIGKKFDSPLFDFTMKNFGKKQIGYCYAGDWSGQLNLATGKFSRCYASRIKQDIFADISKPIDFCAIGSHCRSLFCMNSSHFLALGMIPTQYKDITYAGLRNRDEAHWYSDKMNHTLRIKLQHNNPEYDLKMKLKTELYAIAEASLDIAYKMKWLLRKGNNDAKR